MPASIGSSVKMNDGAAMPFLGLGTWQMSLGDAEVAVRTALKLGYRHIDTAAYYRNEGAVGKAIAQSGVPRGEIFVTTKIANSDHDDPEAAFHASLKKLGLAYIDLYLIHWPVPERNETWTIMERLQKEKLVRSIGVSNFTILHLTELMKTSTIMPAVNQVEFNPFLYQKDLLEFCKKKNIVLEAYSPLSHASMLNDASLRAIASRHDKTPAQLMLRWALQHDVPVIPKSVHEERIRENAVIFDFEISAADMRQLDDLNRNHRTCWDPTDVA